MDSTDEGIYRRDLAGRITYINRAALEQTGYTAGELLGRDAHDMLHHTHLDGTDYPAAECPLQQVIEDRARRPVHRRGVLAQGRHAVSRSTARPTRSSTATRSPGSSSPSATSASGRWRNSQLAAQYQTARVLAEAESVGEAQPRLLAIYCDQLGWQVCAVWVHGRRR